MIRKVNTDSLSAEKGEQKRNMFYKIAKIDKLNLDHCQKREIYRTRK
jgi:hypothetical protein